MSMTSVCSFCSLTKSSPFLTHPLPFPFPFPMTCQRSNFYSTIRISLLFFALSEVVLAEGFDSLLQLPRSRPFDSRVVSEKLHLHVGDHGALGDGSSDDTEAFKRVWEVACSLHAPSQIVIPPEKVFLVHPIDFSGPCQSKVTLQISGRIIAPDDPEAWKGLNLHKWLYFHNIKHLTVLGGGRINGMGRKWWSKSCKRNSSNPCDPAPTAMTFHRCKYLKLQNLMVVNSQQMHVALTNCVKVLVSNLKVIAPPASPNTDGIHISTSRFVMVEDCIIRTGDDCISIVSNSSQINVRNITCGPGHGISIGSLGKYNSWSSVQNVIVDGVLMSNTDNGVRIKTWQGGGGSATDIIFKNIWMDNVANPIIIDQYYCDSFLPCPNQTQSVRVANVTFSKIFGTSATTDAIIFDCSDESPCTDLFLEDVELLSSSGGLTRSLCWEAYGFASGLVYPRPCVAQIDNVFIRQKPEASGSSVLSS